MTYRARSRDGSSSSSPTGQGNAASLVAFALEVATMIKRRTLLQSLLALVGARPIGALVPGSWPWRQATPPALMSDARVDDASAPLPTSCFRARSAKQARAAAVDRFVRWHRNYREAADRGHSYGASTLEPADRARRRRRDMPRNSPRWTTQAQARGARGIRGARDVDRGAQSSKTALNAAAARSPACPRVRPARNLVAGLHGVFLQQRGRATTWPTTRRSAATAAAGSTDPIGAPAPLGRG